MKKLLSVKNKTRKKIKNKRKTITTEKAKSKQSKINKKQHKPPSPAIG